MKPFLSRQIFLSIPPSPPPPISFSLSLSLFPSLFSRLVMSVRGVRLLSLIDSGFDMSPKLFRPGPWSFRRDVIVQMLCAT